ncbi:FAS1 domain protein, partial [Metarhizium majus ARSEF 297]
MEQQSTLPLELDELERLYNQLDGEAPQVSMDCSRDHLTLLELLESEPASNNFAERLKKHHDLLKLLQSTTNGEYTVFVPVDAGWTESDKVQCEENMPHYLNTAALRDWPNLPTLLRTGASNRKPVLQSSFSSSGWWINRCNRIGRRDLCFASEAIRQLSHEELISTTQAQTLFLPSVKAFGELGSDVLNFLSKTEQGRPYMLALLKLHILPQVTVFCNFIWPKERHGREMDLVPCPEENQRQGLLYLCVSGKR